MQYWFKIECRKYIVIGIITWKRLVREILWKFINNSREEVVEANCYTFCILVSTKFIRQCDTGFMFLPQSKPSFNTFHNKSALHSESDRCHIYHMQRHTSLPSMLNNNEGHIDVTRTYSTNINQALLTNILLPENTNSLAE